MSSLLWITIQIIACIWLFEGTPSRSVSILSKLIPEDFAKAEAEITSEEEVEAVIVINTIDKLKDSDERAELYVNETEEPYCKLISEIMNKIKGQDASNTLKYYCDNYYYPTSDFTTPSSINEPCKDFYLSVECIMVITALIMMIRWNLFRTSEITLLVFISLLSVSGSVTVTCTQRISEGVSIDTW
eukprot:96591_1